MQKLTLKIEKIKYNLFNWKGREHIDDLSRCQTPNN